MPRRLSYDGQHISTSNASASPRNPGRRRSLQAISALALGFAVAATREQAPKPQDSVTWLLQNRFALDDKIELVDRHDLSTRITTNVEKALAYKHFYSIDTEDGRDITVERMFATHIEGPAKRAISRLVDEKRSCSLPGLRGPLATFLAFQYVRGPGFRFASVEFFKAIGQKTALLMTPDMAS